MSATSEPTVLVSELDASVNFVIPAELGYEEARYVRRASDYFIVYLSAQTGCRMGCRFCHLTQSRQVEYQDVTIEGILAQADQVLAHYDSLDDPAKVVHFNFMARGDVFANPHVLRRGDELVEALTARARDRDLIARCKFSTIMPRGTVGDLEMTDIFRRTQPDIYLSVYSADPSFRRRWLNKALDLPEALARLARWQTATRKLPVLHWAFIEDENDSVETVSGICEAVNHAGLRADFNIVRYNPYSQGQGQEPPEETVQRNAQLLRDGVPGCRVQVVTRVGFDVKASCGMFVGGRQPASNDAGQLPRV